MTYCTTTKVEYDAPFAPTLAVSTHDTHHLPFMDTCRYYI